MTFSDAILTLAVAGLLQMPGQRSVDSRTGLIVGQVVDGETGRAVAGAIVTMNDSGVVGEGPFPRILTGNDGRFVYRGLRRGSYSISATKPGYVGGAVGRMRPTGPAVPLQLGDGERTADAIIRLWKHASISGAVVDEAGERLVGVRVQAYRRSVISGRRRYVPSASALTDDRGIYRISGLVPGDYIAGAVARHTAVPLSMNDMGFGASFPVNAGSTPPLPSGPVMPVRDAGVVLGNGVPTPPPVENGRLAIYPPIFHPNAPTAAAATIIALAPGAEYVSADLQLKPVTAVSVSGHVIGPDGPVTATPLRLLAADTMEVSFDGNSMTATTDRAGRFTFPAVTSGHYNLRLQSGTPSNRTANTAGLIWTDLPISIGNENIENLVVEAQPGVRIAGRIEFQGRLAGPLPSIRGSLVIEASDPYATSLGARPVLFSDSGSAGEFVSPPLPGGSYYVRIQNSPSGWMFKSATVDGRDIADTPVTVSADLLNVVVTFTDQWSGLRGIVQNRQGVDPAAAVLIFPTDTDTWGSGGTNPRRVRLLRPNRSGEYSVNLPPGDYYVIAVPEAQAADWQDPEFMHAASRAASRVDIVEGERRTQDLRTSEIR